jgi:hypothetical protein
MLIFWDRGSSKVFFFCFELGVFPGQVGMYSLEIFLLLSY